MASIRYICETDREAWFSLDRHLSEDIFREKAYSRQGYVLEEAGELIGVLRYGLFWDSIPFCNLLYIREDCQGKGFGRAMMLRWEQDMAGNGYRLLLTSSQSDEDAQHFYRKLGWRDCGSLMLTDPGFAQPPELFFSKYLG